MSTKKEKRIDLNNLTSEEVMKYEIARELGLLDKVLDSGWKTLTAKETGRIGGLITKRKREAQIDKMDTSTEELRG
ncbi:small, acid-soluble spore protein, alpha/beta type [Novisyntrophococcus fermenticellae]|uniref:small, acid-soluble spore protein, alpha/beta type n=1 Tax=Novisyntrophococcus fermenticellae TaxID=2068655 RepID=UPI001E5FA0C4|nr:small, acid-soluble spore protein, alpha/beta type [Novisyntrophococcus fermenticellae]